MRTTNYKIEVTVSKTSPNELTLTKRNFSSTEMKKSQQFKKSTKIGNIINADLGSITGVGIKELSKYKECLSMNEKTCSIIRKQQVKTVTGDKFMEIVKIKPQLKDHSKIYQDIKELKKNQLKSIETDDQENNKKQLKKALFKKKIIDRLSTLPKLQNSPTSLHSFRKPLLTALDPNLKFIKSQHYFVLEKESDQPLLACRSKSKIQVASLTKIMTFYTVLKIGQQLQIDITKQKIRIDEDIEGFAGTSASLEEGQIYTVEQLLYGLMLPSGNDAAMSLAKWGGGLIRGNSTQSKVKCFVSRMNEQAKKLQLKDTKYGNPHGLPNKNSETTCQDVAKLCSVCLKIPLFLKVVGTKHYKLRVQHQKYKRKLLVEWQNTNKLLRRPGFIGIKTGITVTAGPCLASAYKFRNKTYIVILAKCNKSSRRFKETRKLLVHCLQKMQHKQALTGEEKIQIRRLNRSNEDMDSDYSQEEKEFDFKKSDLDEMNRRARIITTHH